MAQGLAGDPLSFGQPQADKKPKLSFDVRDKGQLEQLNSDEESQGFNIIPDTNHTPEKVGEYSDNEETKNESAKVDDPKPEVA